MKLQWIEPLRFARKRWDWLGAIAHSGRALQVASKCFADKGSREGAAPEPRLAAKIERRLAVAIDNFNSDLEIIVPPLAELYNDYWRPPQTRRLSVAALRKELELLSINLDQGESRYQYRYVFAPKSRFGDHFPYAQFDLGEVCSIGVESPMDSNGCPLLPFPGADKTCARVPSQVPKRIAKKISGTGRVMKPKWVEKLSYNPEVKLWYGRIAFRRARIAISVKHPEKSKAMDWVDTRLGEILACTTPAVGELAEQLTELYNDSWVEDRKLTAVSIKRRITLDAITLDRTGAWSMTFFDDDLFGGHNIQADVSSSGEVSFELVG